MPLPKKKYCFSSCLPIGLLCEIYWRGFYTSDKFKNHCQETGEASAARSEGKWVPETVGPGLRLGEKATSMALGALVLSGLELTFPSAPESPPTTCWPGCGSNVPLTLRLPT